jgi:hypothetical protein
MSASDLERIVGRTPTLHNLVLRHTMALFNQICPVRFLQPIA